MGKDLHNIATYQAGAKQASVHRTLQKLCDTILEPFEITKMQWLIIGHVLDAGKAGIRISDLATALSTTIPYITTAVNILEVRGYLERKSNSQDNRSRLLVVTDSFIPQCETIEMTLRQSLREALYIHIKPEEFRIYMKVLYQLDEAAKHAANRQQQTAFTRAGGI